jgi:hypothetical protein
MKPTTIISFDIGIKNLAYVVLIDGPTPKLHFNLIDVDTLVHKKESKAIGRCRVLHEIFIEALTLIRDDEVESNLTVVIEKQVNTNIMTMSLMYSLISIALCYTPRVKLVPPNQKFIKLMQEYSTNEKAHKHLAVEMSRKLLSERFPDQLDQFNELRKCDDVADAFLMAFVERELSFG